MSKNRKEIQITKDELKQIHGRDHDFFEEKIVSNCHCINCTEKRGKPGYGSTIVHYHIFLLDNGDVWLRGYCSVCGSKIARYLETGEVPEYSEKIREVRKNHSIIKNK